MAKKEKQLAKNRFTTAKRPMDENYQYIERRVKVDFVKRSVPLLAMISFFLLLSTIAIIGKASPAVENMFSKALGVPLRVGWDSKYLRYGLISLFSSIVVSLIGTIFNHMRQRRAEDVNNRAPGILAIIGSVSIIIYVIRFYSYF